jgi:segregation and condensation protein A
MTMMASEADFGEIINHLMFQKAILDDDVGASDRIGEYVKMAEEMQRGTMVATSDPFEACVWQAFDLVVQQQFNPWDINLVEFSKMYLSRVKKATDVNLIMAGKLVYMAWEILRLQSDDAVRRADRPQTVEPMFGGWEPGDFDLFVDPFELGPGEALLYNEEMPIDEKVRRRSDRPVTLIDLLDAFEDAKKESDIRAELSKFMQKYKRPDFDDKSHKESLEDDIASIWDRIQRCGPGAVPITDLCANDKEGRVTAFVAVLFLAKMGKIHIWQDKAPYGEIFLEVKVQWDIVQLEDAPAVETSGLEKVTVVK